MSDNILKLIPQDPSFIPGSNLQLAALERLSSFLPAAQATSIKITDSVEFVDQGSNFEQVSCPNCHRTLDISWWQTAMGRAYETGFTQLSIVTPCCGTKNSL